MEHGKVGKAPTQHPSTAKSASFSHSVILKSVRRTVRGARVEGRRLRLRGLLHLAVEFAGGGLVEFGVRREVHGADGLRVERPSSTKILGKTTRGAVRNKEKW